MLSIQSCLRKQAVPFRLKANGRQPGISLSISAPARSPCAHLTAHCKMWTESKTVCRVLNTKPQRETLQLIL
ncbi:hypothetical protein chiPu_0004462 [Chiloscyllium punctatum]|uniref:Uncharacterized protein n=1 Tax=Chiloscyllium punctatum TaxID=137246 RepID=A0A401S6P5_CHIPU|nr:hypothetical protein [Chiloscyllium punctatum]